MVLHWAAAELVACDLITASTKAKFGQPEVGLGIIPDFRNAKTS